MVIELEWWCKTIFQIKKPKQQSDLGAITKFDNVFDNVVTRGIDVMINVGTQKYSGPKYLFHVFYTGPSIIF